MSFSALKELLGEIKTPPVVAVLDAVPGWHAVLTVDTGMSDPDDPESAYGKTYHQIEVIPIVKWGIPCPAKYNKEEQEREPSAGFGSLFGALGSTPIDWGPLPLDPRKNEPTFLPVDRLFAVYPPSVGGAQAVMARVKQDVERATEKEIKRRKAKEER